MGDGNQPDTQPTPQTSITIEPQPGQPGVVDNSGSIKVQAPRYQLPVDKTPDQKAHETEQAHMFDFSDIGGTLRGVLKGAENFVTTGDVTGNPQATEQRAERELAQKQAENEGEEEYRQYLFRTAPHELGQAEPLEYVKREANKYIEPARNYVENAIAEPALRGMSPAVRQKVEPQVKALAEVGTGAYPVFNLASAGPAPEPAMLGTALPIAGEGLSESAIEELGGKTIAKPSSPEEITRVHNETGGSTFHPTKGNLAGTEHYSVGAHLDREEIVHGELTPQHVQNFIEKNKDLLANPDKSVGTWRAAPDKHVLDIVETPTDREKAIELGKQNNQQAIFDLKNMEEIPIGGKGGAALQAEETVPSTAQKQAAEAPITYRTDNLGIRWAKSPDSPAEVSIPSRITDPAEVEKYAQEKLDLQKQFVKPELAKGADLLPRSPEYANEKGSVLSDINHETGHVIGAYDGGIKIRDGIWSDRHPKIGKGNLAQVQLDFSSLLPVDSKGRANVSSVAEEDVDKILRTYLGGAAADEVFHNIPLEKNGGARTDLSTTKKFLTALGFSKEKIDQRINEQYNHMKNRLTDPGLQAIIRKYTTVREEGLPDTHHMSQEKVEQMMKEIQDYDKQKSGNAGRHGELDVEGNREDDAGRKSQNEGVTRSALGSAETEPKPKVNPVWDAAVKQYGTTLHTNKAGFIGPDGTMLDFSEGQGARVLDHGDIASVEGVDKQNPRNSFVAETGAMRVLNSPKFTDIHFDVNHPPTQNQLARIWPLIKDGKSVNIDVSTGDSTVPLGGAMQNVRTPEELDRLIQDARTNAQKKEDLLTHERQSVSKTAESPEFTEKASEFVSPNYIPDKSNDKLFHVTTAFDKVNREGLKPRSETKTIGLGGGFKNDAPDKISVTFDENHAMEIENRLKLAVQAARNDFSPSQALDKIMNQIGVSDDAPEPVAQVLGAPERTWDDWEEFDKWFDKNYPADDPYAAYAVVSELDGAVNEIFPDSENNIRVGLTADRDDIKKIDPNQIGVVEVEARRGANAQHVSDESELRFSPQDVRVKKTAESPENLDKLRISTRVPKGKSAIKNPLEKNLTINRETVNQTPGLPDKLAARVKTYPGLRLTPSEAKSPRMVLSKFQRHIVDNLKYLWNSVPPEQREQTAKWYDSAHKLAGEYSDKYGVTPSQSASIIASLSPQKDWDMNVSLADRVLDTVKNKKDIVTTPEMMAQGAKITTPKKVNLPDGRTITIAMNPKVARVLDKLPNKSYSQLTDPVEKAAWVRLYDEAHNPREFHSIDPATGESRGLRLKQGKAKGGTLSAMQFMRGMESSGQFGEPEKVAWGSLDDIGKAISIIEDGSRANISDKLGDAHKVRNFYNNIVHPNAGDDVTIDTHAVAAGLMRPLSGKSPEVMDNFGGPKSSKTGSIGTYPVIADAYRQAAKELDIPYPRMLQSVVWEKIRDLFPSEFKTPENNAEIEKIWRDYSRGKITIKQARQRIVDFAEQHRSGLDEEK